jgi:biotin transport system substrate-specific component
MERTTSFSKTHTLVLSGLFAALMAVGAFIKIMIPLGIWQVTFSLQFFFALLAGMVLGSKNGFISVMVYLIVGLCGVPIFAHGGGLGYLLKPTFGFLIGFAAAALVCGWCLERTQSRSFKVVLFAAFLGEMAYYLCGLVYYYVTFNFLLMNGQSIGIVSLIEVWFLSTVVPDFCLCVLAALTFRRLLPVFRK